MIKVITHGQKKFKTICPTCGCEFEYEYEDLNKEELGTILPKYVKCPDCGEMILHKEQTPPTITWGPGVRGIDKSCEDCDWYKRMMQEGFSYFGDSPCDLCSKTRFTCDFNAIHK